MIPFAYFYLFFVQNMVCTYGLVLYPYLNEDSGFTIKKENQLFLVLGFLLSSFILFFFDWFFCQLLDLEFLRVFLLFLGICLTFWLVRTLSRKLLELHIKVEFEFYKLLELNVMLVGFIMLLTQSRVGFAEYALAVLGTLCGYGVALFLHSCFLNRLKLESLPESVRGRPLSFFAMGLVSLIILIFGILLQESPLGDLLKLGS